MGDGWGRLSPVVQAVHLQGDVLEAAGTFEVTHGKSPFVRLINTLTGMPRPSHAQSIRLTINQKGDGEEWTRRFGDLRLASYQEELPGRVLAERFGLLELLFDVTADGGGIVYHNQGANLKMGGLRIRLPHLLAPRVEASESVGDGGSAQILIRVSLPMLGPQLSYGGQLASVSTENNNRSRAEL